MTITKYISARNMEEACSLYDVACRHHDSKILAVSWLTHQQKTSPKAWGRDRVFKMTVVIEEEAK